MATIDLDQTECLKNYQIFEKYFFNTELADCSDFRIIDDTQTIYSSIESSNHSQVITQRLLIDANPKTLKELFDFFCKNKYLEIKPCCSFIDSGINELYIYFIGHNDNRSLFGESASMNFNFVATLIVTEINHVEHTIRIELSFTPFSPFDRDYYHRSLSHDVKVHLIQRIAQATKNNVFELLSKVHDFLVQHDLPRTENEDMLLEAFTAYSNTIDSNGLPLSFTKPVVWFLSDKNIISLKQSSFDRGITQWINDLFHLNYNYDFEFYSSKSKTCLNVSEMLKFVAKTDLDELLQGDWFAIIYPMPNQVQVDNFLKQNS